MDKVDNILEQIRKLNIDEIIYLGDMLTQYDGEKDRNFETLSIFMNLKHTGLFTEDAIKYLKYNLAGVIKIN